MQPKTPVALYIKVGTRHTRNAHPRMPVQPPPRPSPHVDFQNMANSRVTRTGCRTRKQQDGKLRTARQRRSLIDSCKALGVRQKLVKNSCCWVLIDNVFILTAETLQTVVGLRRSPSLAHTWTHTHTDNGKSFNRWLRSTQPQYLKKTTFHI